MHDLLIYDKLFIDLLSSRINDLLKLLERYHIGQLFWPILSSIGLLDFHTIVLIVLSLSSKLSENCDRRRGDRQTDTQTRVNL